MEDCLEPFIAEVNRFIAYVSTHEGIVSAITFNTNANLVYQHGTAPLRAFQPADCTNSTNHAAALDLALIVIEETSWEFDSRIIMVTDGEPIRTPSEQIERMKSKGIRLDPIFLRTVLAHERQALEASCRAVLHEAPNEQALQEIFEAHDTTGAKAAQEALGPLAVGGGAVRTGFVAELTQLMIAAASSH
jgi:hypothetical protein